MNPEQLLKECATLSYAGRMRRMVEVGGLAASDASVRQTIAQLAQSGVYQRSLATQACYGSRDSAQALRALADPSRSVRSLGLNLVALICSDAELQNALENSSLEIKFVLLRKLGRDRRQAAIDAYLETLVARRDGDLSKLLRFGSLALVALHFGQVVEHLAFATWRRLANKHFELVIEYFRERATASTSLDPQLVLQINNVLPSLANMAPDATLELVKIFIGTIPLARLNLQNLVRKRPNEVVDLLLQADEQSNLRFDAVVHRLETERLLALFTRYPGTISTGRFHKLTPQQRLAVYTACERGWRNADGVLALHVVAHLPTAQREQEARRHQALPALATRPLERLRYAAFLPWDEARTLLDPSLRSPDADLRGAVLSALIGATRYQREHLADAFGLVLKRRNEQDPVRHEMLTALANLPHSIWQTEHLENLAQIIQDALDATDLSRATAGALEQLVVHTFPFHPQWSARQIAIIYRKRGHVTVYRMDTYLSNADMQHIAPEIAPVLQSWQQRESDGLLISLAHALGRRLKVFTELLDRLPSVLDYTLVEDYADWILRLFREYSPERLAQAVPRLLEQDKSCIVLPTVYTYLHEHRQDLLTPFLGQHAYKGRFSTGRTRFVLRLDDGFYRWTPTQQEIFAQTLLNVANDNTRPTYETLSTIHRLAAMPALSPSALITFASDTRPPVREAALRALGMLDAGQGIPTLLEALNDERARIAIYALRNSLLAMPKTEALALLRNAPLTQVTVAKEVVRLIGDLSSEAAYRELLVLNERELHRDVRVALLRAFWSHVEQTEAWEIFTHAAQSPDVALARGVVHIPTDGISSRAQQRLAALIATLLAHPAPEVRMDALQRCSEHPLSDTKHLLFNSLLATMNSLLPDECTLATQAVFAIYTGNEAGQIGEAIRSLLSNRRALLIAGQNFLAMLSSSRQHLLPTTRSFLAALATDRLTLALRIEIIIHGLPWDEVSVELLKLTDNLHADALGRAENALMQATKRPDARLFDLEIVFAASNDERLRRLALTALVAQAQQASGWSDEATARLEKYREDPSPLVAEAAQFTFAA